jgi:CRP-like cAMP-binding protein
MADREIINGLPWSKGLTTRTSTEMEIRRLIESTNWADNLSGKEIETLAGYFHVCHAEADTVIVREGGREAYLCLLVEGQVKVVKEGKELGSARPGRIVGEMSLVDGEPRSASVITVEPTLMLVLTGEQFSLLAADVPRLAITILLKTTPLLSQRLRHTSGTLLEYLGD